MAQMTNHQVTERAASLADGLMARGRFSDPAWRQALIDVPRHLFVPHAARAMPDFPAGEPYTIDAEERPAQWWDAVYSDTAIVTQLDEGASDPTAETGIPTSSASAPGVVAAFLELLDVRDHDRVLEIGTGTGYTAALLSHRLGAGNVTSIEVDKEVAAQAAANLKAAGYGPRLVVGDGGLGWPDGAPYDRVHVTCAVERVPAALIEQTRPGGLIVLPWSPAPHTGYMIRLDVLGDGRAVGRIIGSAGYMMMRSQRRDATWRAHHSDQAEHTFSQVDPRTVTQGGLGADLAILSLVPGLNCRPVLHPDTGEFELLLWDVDNSSWAECDYEPGSSAYDVYSYGPRRLWEEVYRAYLRWLSQGRPGIERFGLTVGPGGHHRVWLDHPDHLLTPATLSV
jgi:protein-L-isoaspartate(D-aspartate) O-methyltransferase